MEFEPEEAKNQKEDKKKDSKKESSDEDKGVQPKPVQPQYPKEFGKAPQQPNKNKWSWEAPKEKSQTQASPMHGQPQGGHPFVPPGYPGFPMGSQHHSPYHQTQPQKGTPQNFTQYQQKVEGKLSDKKDSKGRDYLTKEKTLKVKMILIHSFHSVLTIMIK